MMIAESGKKRMKRLLLILLLLAIITPSNTSNDDCCQQPVSEANEHRHRQLLENVTNNNTNTSNDVNSTNIEDDIEELPSCNDVLLHETASERCNHAQNCDGEYIMVQLLPLAFCNDPTSPSPLDNHHPIVIILFPVLFPISLLVLTILLFRLLGSTAENYFSPALEMISSEFHIVSTFVTYHMMCSIVSIFHTNLQNVDYLIATSTSRGDIISTGKWSTRCISSRKW